MWECYCEGMLECFLFLGSCEGLVSGHRLMLTQLIPAPRGTGLVASPAVKRLLQLAGVGDVYTASAGSTKTLENTLKATFVAVAGTYGFLTPNLWKEAKLERSPLEEYSDVLREGKRY